MVSYKLLRAVSTYQFCGLDGEDPVEHLSNFNRLCALHTARSDVLDATKMTIFSFSLSGLADEWKRSMPSELLASWTDVQTEFMRAFYPMQKTLQKRVQINEFEQEDNENFCDAWERMRDYTRECPHHGFSKRFILDTLYRGCHPRDKDFLNSVCEGNFLDISVEDGEYLVEKTAHLSRQNVLAEMDQATQPTYGETAEEAQQTSWLNTSTPDRGKAILSGTETGQAHEEMGEGTPKDSWNEGFDTIFNASILRGTWEEDISDGTRYDDLINGSTSSSSPITLHHVSVKEHPPEENNFKTLGEEIASQEKIDHCYYLSDSDYGQEIPTADVAADESDDETLPNQIRESNLINRAKDLTLEMIEHETFRCPPVPPDEEYQLRMRQDAAYRKVFRALSIIGDSIEHEYLVEHSRPFKEHYVKMLACAEWYNSMSDLTGPRPLRPQSPSHNQCHYTAQNLLYGAVRSKRKGTKKARFGDPAVFPLPCLIGGTAFAKSILNTRSKYNLMTLTTCKELGLTQIRPLHDPPSRIAWMTKKPVGTVKNLEILFQGHTIVLDFLVVNTGEFDKKKVICGRPFLRATKADVDIIDGVISFNLGTYCADHRIWQIPKFTAEGRPFNITTIFFFKDLARMGSEQAQDLGGLIRELCRDEIDELYTSRAKDWDKMYLYDEGGEALPPNNFEIDPGDLPYDNPGPLSPP